MKFLKAVLLVSVCLTSPLEAVKVIDFSFKDATDWTPTVRIQKDGAAEREEPQSITMTGSLQDLEDYDPSEPTDPLPVLNIKDPASCLSFYERLKAWVAQIKLTSLQFVFKGEYEDQELSIPHAHPFHQEFSLRLHLVEAQLLPEKGKLIFNKFSAITDSDVQIDLMRWIPQAFVEYELPDLRKSGSKPGMVAVKFDGAAHEWKGREISYKRPCVPGVIGLTEPEALLTRRESSTGSELYKNAQAARVWKKAEREQHKAGIFVFPKGVADPEGSETSEASEGSGRWQSDRSQIDRSSIVDDSISLYEASGPERLIESPFMYSDGERLFLTKTYEQPCREAAEGAAAAPPPFFLTYTVPTPFKIVAESRDIRLREPSKFERGLYAFKRGSWYLLDSNYNPLRRHGKYKAKPMDSDPLSQGAQAMQKASFPEMTGIYKHLGEMTGFIKTHPDTLQDDAHFRDYHARIYSKGLLKTMLSIPQSLEHLIIPLLLTVRENPELEDPQLWRPDTTTRHTWHHHKLCTRLCRLVAAGVWEPVDVAWGQHCIRVKKFSELISDYFVTTGEEIAILKFESLRCLPLFKGKGFSLIIPEYVNPEDHPRIFSAENYKDLARFISLNQLTQFHFHGCLDSSTLTIQAFADALRDQTSISEFLINEGRFNIGNIENMRYLLLNGIAPSSSITHFMWYRFIGDEIYALIGEMISRNKSITQATFYSMLPRDLEALNRFGRGFENNKTIKEVSFDLHTTHFKEESYSYPLPDRPAGMTTADLSGFTQGIINNTSLTSMEFFAGSNLQLGYSAVIKAIKAIHRPGLRIRLIYPEGSRENYGAGRWDEWEG